MTAVITNSIRISNAINFMNSLNTSSFYLGVGKVTEWPDELLPPTPATDIHALNEVWRNAFGLKRISTYDSSLMIPRVNWTSGTIYSQYTDDIEDLNTLPTPFYVMTSTYDVFKCLYNNGNAASMVEPTVAAPEVGGYRWRWMYNISVSDRNKFMTTDYIPVTAMSSGNQVAGEITRIDVINSGTGYTTASAVIVGDGVGATATVNLSGGEITSITLDNAGTSYNYADIVITGDGADAVVSVVLSPNGGHGNNIPDELLAFYVMISATLNFDESGTLLTNNDFRQVFLVKDPYTYGTTTVETDANINMTTRIVMDDVSNFSQDQVVQIWLNSSVVGTAVVAHQDVVNSIIHLTNITSPTITATHKIFDGVSQVGIAVGGITFPGVSLYSGSIHYVLNRSPIIRDIGQTETFKIPFSW